MSEIERAFRAGYYRARGIASNAAVDAAWREYVRTITAERQAMDRDRSRRCLLRDTLLALFALHDLNVRVGLISEGVAIHSQDKRVDAANIGTIIALERPSPAPESERGE